MKTSQREKKQQYLVLVAHPDDETLFFSSILFKYKQLCKVICVTDGNADGLGQDRQSQFKLACSNFGVKTPEIWNFPDKFDARIDTAQLEARLLQLPRFKSVFTHGVLGEYGHPHHQDVCFAAHRAFAKKSPVYSVTYNNFPELRISLNKSQYTIKTKILTDIYHSEIRRFVNFVPATYTEGFSKVGLNEIEEIYGRLSSKTPINFRKLKSYHWLAKLLQDGDYVLPQRPF